MQPTHHTTCACWQKLTESSIDSNDSILNWSSCSKTCHISGQKSKKCEINFSSLNYVEWKISRMGVTVFAVVVAAAQVDLQLIVKVIKSWEWDFPVVCSWWRDWKINPRQNQGGAIREARLKLRKEYWSKSYWNYWNVLIEKHHLHIIKIKYYERTNMQTFDGYSSTVGYLLDMKEGN